MKQTPRLILTVLLVMAGIADLTVAATIHVPQDYKTIQAAVDQASAGDTILVTAGIYRERVRLKEGITLRSAGDDARGTLGLKRAEAVILDGGGKDGDGPGVAMAEGSTLNGLTVTNVGLYDDVEWKKHHATQGNEQPHEHIGQPGTAGVSVIGVNCTIRHNIVHHIGYTGIAIQGVAGRFCTPQVQQNICYRNMGGGIGSMRGSTAIIESNVCYQNFYAGIGHEGAAPLVVNNECYENIRAGIGVSEGAKPVVRGNKCYHNRRAGIGIRTDPSTAPVIEDNDCYENDMAGIGCEERCAPLVRSNRCYKNALAGIGCRDGARPLIVGNECRDNEMAGIGVEGGAAAVIQGNKCLNNKLVAVGVTSAATATILDNELSRTGGAPPIIAVKEGSSALIHGNRISGGGVAAVLIQGKATIDGNTFTGIGEQQGNAVWVWEGSTAAISENSFVGYRTAINAMKAAVVISENKVKGFRGTAIVVKDGAPPPHVFGNTAISADPAAKVVDVSGPSGVVEKNGLQEE
jgi:hypothetical protein